MVCGRMGIGEVRAPDRIERAGRDGERAIDRIGAAMGADDVAILRARHRADDRSALARGGGAPLDREAQLGARRRMRGNADMVNPIGTSHHDSPRNGDGPPKQTGLVTKDENWLLRPQPSA